MKNKFNSFAAVILAVLMLFTLCSCSEAPSTEETTAETTTASETTKADVPELWKNAAYIEDTEIGNGSKVLKLEVTAEDKTVTFTVKTDKETVGEALLEYGIIAGENGDYGLYVKTVNGILADYAINQKYWAFYIGDEYASTGVDSTNITEGATYKLVYSE